MIDLSATTATALLAALASGEVSATEALHACLDRVATDNAGVNAVVALDAEAALGAAATADRARAAGRLLGPLHGLPMTVKDVFETAGLVTTAGAAELAGHVPARDADAVARLRAAGAVIFGKTNVPRYAGDFQTWNALHGRTANPWDLTRTPGGSSGGSAAAVATGMSLLELGSDIAGSLRAPAHYCGVFAHLPSWSAVPGRGHIPPAPGSLAVHHQGTAGPIGPCVDDLELALDVLTGADLAGVPGGRLPAHEPPARGYRVGVWLDNPLVRTDRESVACLRRLLDRLDQAGAAVVERIRPPRPFYEMHEVAMVLLFGTVSQGFTDEEYAELAAGPDTPLAAAVTQSHRQWLATEERRARIEAAWSRVFAEVDVVLTPVTPLPAFPHDTERPPAERELCIDGRGVAYYLHTVWTDLAGLARLPATVVPAGRTSTGLPVGAQIIGPRWADRRTLAVARWVEQLTGGFTPPPRSAVSARSAGMRP